MAEAEVGTEGGGHALCFSRGGVIWGTTEHTMAAEPQNVCWEASLFGPIT